MNERIDYREIIESRRNPNKKFESDLRFIVILTAVFVAIVFIFTHVFVGVQVYGDSMKPTLHNGDRLYLSTFSTPERGDIVVFHHNDVEYIKRVIGIEGDTVYSKDGKLFRRCKGETEFSEVDESYLGEDWSASSKVKLLTVPKGKLYVLGDNRNNSSDSRSFGCILADDVVGVVTNWSLRNKEFLTGFFEFFKFGQPAD